MSTWFYDTGKWHLGLNFLHNSNIIHDDLRPENVIVVRSEDRENLFAKLSDVGIITRLHGYKVILENRAFGRLI